MSPRILSQPIHWLRVCRKKLRTHYPPIDRRRPISTYGYNQSKTLAYSHFGQISDVLYLHRYSISPPHSTSITLRTLCSPLNPADINQIQGLYPTRPQFTNELSTLTPSAVPGNEACFEVLATGASVKSVAKGDWVIPRATGLGTWRTHLQVDESVVMKVNKDGLSSAQVATVSVNPLTAWRMLKDFADLQEGDWFIHNGANSGVGRAAIQLGKLWGLRSIAVVRERRGKEGEELKRELEELGATKVVTAEMVIEKGFRDQVKEWTNGGREAVKLGLNCVGGRLGTAMAKGLDQGSHMVTYGAMSKRPFAVGARTLMFQDVRFSGFWVSRWGDAHPDRKRETIDRILDLIRDRKFKDAPTVDVPWNWGTKKTELVKAVDGTLDGYRKGKGIFVFGDT